MQQQHIRRKETKTPYHLIYQVLHLYQLRDRYISFSPLWEIINQEIENKEREILTWQRNHKTTSSSTKTK